MCEESDLNGHQEAEPMFSPMSYDPLEVPNSDVFARDLEDQILERSTRFFNKKSLLGQESEKCYVVGLEDKSKPYDESRFSLEESLAELSELAGAAGLTVVGSSYQRVNRPSIEYYIGRGKVKEVSHEMTKRGCCTVIFDTELTPSQQKNLEASFNQDSGWRQPGSGAKAIKVVDRTALILDIFAQHARTREGKLQVQLALLTYRLPRLTNMWSHLGRQSAGARGKSNGGVGLRGPGETQLESDRRMMKKKVSALKKSIDAVRRHRQLHRSRRRRLGVPVVALVGYTNAGKSSLLNALAPLQATGSSPIFAADMLFATLDPTTRMVKMPGMKHSDMLMTDTVGFIQRLPTHLVAAFRATLEEVAEADLLLHVTDVTTDGWRKQEASVLRELERMGLQDRRVVTVWNKIDAVPDVKSYLVQEAQRRPGRTVPVSALTGEGLKELLENLQASLEDQMVPCSLELEYGDPPMISALHSLAALDSVVYEDDFVRMSGKVPDFLYEQLSGVDGVRLFDPAGQLVAGTPLAKDEEGASIEQWLREQEALQGLSEDEQIAAWLEYEERKEAAAKHTLEEEDVNGAEGGGMPTSDSSAPEREVNSSTRTPPMRKTKGKHRGRAPVTGVSDALVSSIIDAEAQREDAELDEADMDFAALAKRRPRGLGGKRARDGRRGVWLARPHRGEVAEAAARAVQAAIDQEVRLGRNSPRDTSFASESMWEMSGSASESGTRENDDTSSAAAAAVVGGDAGAKEEEEDEEEEVEIREVLNDDMDGQWIPDE